MTGSKAVAILAAAVVALFPEHAAVSAQAALGGRWALNRDASQFPREVGFDTNWATGSDTQGGGGGGRGRRGGGGAALNPFNAQRESEDDAKRLRRLTDEVRTPPVYLEIDSTPSGVTITTERGQPRTLHPDGKEELLHLEADVPLAATARWEADRLVVVYQVEDARQLRYAYSTAGTPPQLVVEATFVDHGKAGDSVRRTYDRTTSGPPPVPTSQPSARPAQAPAGGGQPAGTMPAAGGTAPASQPATAKADLRPGAELKGLTRLGLVVEDLGSQAIACGLTQDALEKAASKSLTDAGLQVVRNSDEDTYLYVNVMAASMSSGVCVSRYDATLYSHTTAPLAYTSGPVLVQVELLHKGGIAGGTPAANGQAVIKGITQFVDQFTSQIRDASKR